MNQRIYVVQDTDGNLLGLYRTRRAATEAIQSYTAQGWLGWIVTTWQMVEEEETWQVVEEEEQDGQ